MNRRKMTKTQLCTCSFACDDAMRVGQCGGQGHFFQLLSRSHITTARRGENKGLFQRETNTHVNVKVDTIMLHVMAGEMRTGQARGGGPLAMAVPLACLGQRYAHHTGPP